jgi:hypothetical protein
LTPPVLHAMVNYAPRTSRENHAPDFNNYSPMIVEVVSIVVGKLHTIRCTRTGSTPDADLDTGFQIVNPFDPKLL